MKDKRKHHERECGERDAPHTPANDSPASVLFGEDRYAPGGSWPEYVHGNDQPSLNKTGPRPATCIICGCTDERACPGGCSWVYVDRAAGVGLCSQCAACLAESDDEVKTEPSDRLVMKPIEGARGESFPPDVEESR